MQETRATNLQARRVEDGRRICKGGEVFGRIVERREAAWLLDGGEWRWGRFDGARGIMTVVPVGNGDVVADCALRAGESALRFGK